jgi:anti-sigma B factor antagonist
MGAVPIDIQSRRVGPVTVVTGQGRIVEGDETRALQDHLNSVLQRSSNIVLNLGAVDFLDSGGLGLLVRFYNRTQTAQGSLKLCGVPANIAEVLRITKLNTLLESYDTEEAAITASYHRAASPRPEFRFDADILCVDSSADVVAYVRELLKQAGYGVVTAENAPDALTLLRAAQPKLVIVGAQLRGTRSTRTTETLNRLADEIGVIELPADFSSRDAAAAAEHLLGEVRARLGR